MVPISPRDRRLPDALPAALFTGPAARRPPRAAAVRLLALAALAALAVTLAGTGCPEPQAPVRPRPLASDAAEALSKRFGSRCDACFDAVAKQSLGRRLTPEELRDRGRRRRALALLRTELGLCVTGRGYGGEAQVSPGQVAAWLRAPSCPAFARAAFGGSECVALQSVLEEVGFAEAPPRPRVARRVRRPGAAPPPKVRRARPIWRARIGRTTYRGTIHLWQGMVVVDSNGRSLKSHVDPEDAVYLLDAKTGRQIRKIVPPGTGQKDCNGVALNARGLFFGTDQQRFYHYDWRGNRVWQAALRGDPESPPALVDLNGDGIEDAVFGTDTGYVYALDGRRGRRLWSFRTGKGAYGQQSIYAAPAVLRLGKEALVYVAARDHVLYALRGRTGRRVWTFKAHTALRASPLLTDTDGDGLPELLFASAYGVVYVADPLTGRLRWHRKLTMPSGGIVGIFASLGYLPERRCVLVVSSWWQRREALWCVGRQRVLWRLEEPRENLTSTPVLADVDGDGKVEAVYGTESGYLLGVDARGRPRLRWRLAGPVEISPLVADADGDGRLDIFVADNAGFLYRFELPTRGKVAVGYYRGDPRNHGVWGQIKPYPRRRYRRLLSPRSRSVRTWMAP